MKEFIIYDRYESIYRMNFFERNIPIFILIIMMLGIYLFRKKIRGNLKIDRFLRYTLATISILITLIYYMGRWIYIGINPDTLPFHLCYICNIISIIMLISKNKKIHAFLLFAGIIGGLSSLISVDVTLSSRYLKYYYFMIIHINIIIVPLYFSIVHRYCLKYKDIIKAFLYLQGLGILMGFINNYFNSNYFFVSFTSNVAAKGTILEDLGSGYSYFINLEVLSLVYLILWLLINKVINNIKKKKLRIIAS